MGYFPQTNTLEVGGYLFNQAQLTSGNFVVLNATVSSGAVRTIARKANGTAGYQIPTGKTLTIMAAVAWAAHTTTNAAYSLELFTSTADQGQNFGGAATGEVDAYGGGTAGSGSSYNTMTVSGLVNGKAEAYIHDFTIAANLYVGLYSRLSQDVSITLYGILS